MIAPRPGGALPSGLSTKSTWALVPMDLVRPCGPLWITLRFFSLTLGCPVCYLLHTGLGDTECLLNGGFRGCQSPEKKKGGSAAALWTMLEARLLWGARQASSLKELSWLLRSLVKLFIIDLSTGYPQVIHRLWHRSCINASPPC